MTTLPQEILERSERVLAFHHSTRWSERSIPAAAARPAPAPPGCPVASLPRVPLPTNVLDLPVPAMRLLEQQTDALPESMRDPPQNLRTLATWLFMSAGVTWPRKGSGVEVRACPSPGWVYPCEIYVAAFGIEGLEPGFYHFSPGEFCLRKLRDAAAALALLKRGRPDLDFLKTTPGAVLVSTVFARAAVRFDRRGYRAMLLEAGQLTENLGKVAAALGVRSLTRLRVSDSGTRELIGIADDADPATLEAVQTMVVWADAAQHPLAVTSLPSDPLPPIPRTVAAPADPIQSMLQAHRDAVAPGVAIREIRPPLTDLSPLPASTPMIERSAVGAMPGGSALSRVLLKHTFAQQFTRLAVPRDAFLHANRLTFRGGTYFPLVPDGVYPALVRPYWIIHDVVGLDAGVWFYDPRGDRFAALHPGGFRLESSYFCLEDAKIADAAAVCVMVANLGQLLGHAGPDAYRLSLLEAGVLTQRLYLAMSALGLAVRGMPAFFDEPIRHFLGLEQTGWEVLAVAAVGAPPNATSASLHAATHTHQDLGFRD